MLIRTLSLAALLACALPSFAHDYKVGELVIDHPWSRELPPNAPAGAAYFTLKNHGESDRLLGASTPRAQKSELHTHLHQNGMMKMMQIPAVEVPAHGEVSFQPGGNHVMMFGLSKPLKVGDEFPMTLEFEKAGKIEVVVKVESADSQGQNKGHDMPMEHGEHQH